jgi:hypothetical protein
MSLPSFDGQRPRTNTIRHLVREVLDRGGSTVPIEVLVQEVEREFPFACGGRTYVAAIKDAWMKERGLK